MPKISHKSKMDKLEVAKEKAFQDRLKKHKCFNCPFRKFTGKGFFCFIPGCLKDRGSE